MMGRLPYHDGNGLKKGTWTPEEDRILVDYIQKHGHGSWRALPQLAGLNRCGKSCRYRWTTYLRPDIKRGKFSEEEEQTIINLHKVLGNKWSTIATHLPGRTDNEIKNFWNTRLMKKLLQMGIDPVTHRPRTDLNILANLPQLLAAANFSNLMNIPLDNALRLQSDAAQLAKIQLLHNILQVLGTCSSSCTPPTMEAMNLILAGPTFQENHQLYELLRINSRHEGNGNLPFGFATHELPQLQSNILNIEAYQHQPQFSQYHQPMKVLKICSNNNVQFASSSSSSALPTSTPPLPALVPASPELPPTTVNQTENKINPNDNPSFPSTTFEALGNLMDDEASDSHWRDIIQCTEDDKMEGEDSGDLQSENTDIGHQSYYFRCTEDDKMEGEDNGDLQSENTDIGHQSYYFREKQWEVLPRMKKAKHRCLLGYHAEGHLSTIPSAGLLPRL